MVNAAGSPTFYEFDSTELLVLPGEMDDRDEEPLVIYHSHTATEAYPSRADIALARSRTRTTCSSPTRECGITRPGLSSGRTESWTEGDREEIMVTDDQSTEQRRILMAIEVPHPDDLAHLHRWREVRDRGRRHAGRGHRPRGQPHPGIREQLVDSSGGGDELRR
ncbi:MAG: Mov34/MPN/PAD-1 family protein [Nocardioides sp.]